MDAALAALVERVRGAAAARMQLCIRAGGTKDFYGNAPRGELLDPRVFQGVVAYEPTELFVTARAGTSLAELERILATRNQILPFEPPHFGAGATVGGCIAAGLAGPRRAFVGGLRDFVLGAKLLDGQGRVLSFGGTVMKNVAGYDVARFLAGSLGVLGVIVEVTFKVLPAPVEEQTLRFEMTEAAALEQLNSWLAQPLSISASAWLRSTLWVRISGATAAVRSARAALGGDFPDPEDARRFWSDVREHEHEFFASALPLWRISMPSTAPSLQVEGEQLIEWGGAQRWVRTWQSPDTVRARAQASGGHATLFRGGDRSQGVFPPLAPVLATIHRRLKAEFDPSGIFNPGRMYPDL